MSLPPESIDVGQCYLSDNGRVRRIVAVLPGSRVQFEWRYGHLIPKTTWRADVLDLRSFAFLAERPVPCDWTPEREG